MNNEIIRNEIGGANYDTLEATLISTPAKLRHIAGSNYDAHVLKQLLLQEAEKIEKASRLLHGKD